MKKAYEVALDIIELYVPAVTFVTMFVIFILQILFRYALNSPLTWAYEATVLTFIWTTLLAACYMRRKFRHIMFTMFYERRSVRVQMAFRLIGNLLVLLACAASFLPTLDYVRFISADKSPVLRIPFSIGFFPVLVFVALIGLHSLEDIIRDIRSAVARKGGAE